MELCQAAKKGIVKTAACTPLEAFPVRGEGGPPAAGAGGLPLRWDAALGTGRQRGM